jgi:hypothetical protein
MTDVEAASAVLLTGADMARLGRALPEKFDVSLMGATEP